MKKIIAFCLTALAFSNASAQFIYTLPDPDTLKINLNTGSVKYLSTDINNIDFSDPKKIVVTRNDNQSISYYRSALKDMRFYNRYSNPGKLLTEERFGAYEGLFKANYDYSNSYYLYACLASDEMLGGGAATNQWASYDFLQGNKSYFKVFENDSYEAVYKINELIKMADQLPDNVDKKVADHTKGEMLFLRAYHHYELASLFENIQVITDNSSWEEKNKTFTPAEIWGQIMLDLKNAINLMDGSLCPSLREDGRVSRYAAEAMLARAFLFYTGFYQGKHDIAKENASVALPDGSTLTKQQVIEYLDEVISQSPFYLVNDFRNLWPYTNRYTVEENPETADQGLKWVEDDGAINPEVLFKIRFNTKATWMYEYSPGYSNRYALLFGHRDMYGYNISNESNEKDALFPIGHGWGAGTVAPNLYEDWETVEPEDLRRQASIQNLNTIDNYDARWYSKDEWQKTTYHEKKISPIIGKVDAHDYSYYQYRTFELMMFFPGGQTSLSNNFQGGSIHPLNLIRLSDVYLMQSELTGTVDGINKVRERAGLRGISNYSLKALQQERRWELAFEGVRWNDMRRWGDDYCTQALDRQLNQPIINCQKDAKNTGALFGCRNYSQQYAVTHGFIKPVGGNVECQKSYDALGGEWTYGALNGVTYGTLKYKGVSSEDFLSNLEGMIKGYSIDEMKQQVKAAEGEVSEFAHMVINGSTLMTISALGDTIQGTITLHETQDYDWRACTATVDDGLMLGNNGCSKFDIIKLDDLLVLVDATSGKVNEEAQFWVFRKATSNDRIMYSLVNKKWSYAVFRSGVVREDGYWDYSNYGFSGPWGVGGWFGSTIPGTTNVPIIYCTQLEGTLPTGLAAKASSWGITDTRDADPYAYMEFNLNDKTVSKYTRDGQLIVTGQFEYLDGYLTVHNNATLFPYNYYGEGETVERFNLRYSQYGYDCVDLNSEILTFQDASGASPWTFWTFGLRGYTAEELLDALDIRQYDKYNNPAADGCYFTVSFKDGRRHNFGFECTDGSKIFSYDGYSRVDAEKGKVCEKELRFWLVNCNNDTVSVCKTFTFNIDPKPLLRFYIYGDPSGNQSPVTLAADGDAAAGHFSDSEGTYFPYISDEVYFGLKTLIFDLVAEGGDAGIWGEPAGPAMLRVMNGWWSALYADEVELQDGPQLWELPITEEMAWDCARGGDGKDLNLLVRRGTVTINSVYYEEER